MTGALPLLPDVEWELTRPFWEGCRAGVLRMPRCACGEYVWYPQPLCPACHRAAIEWVAVTGNASLFTWTTVYRAAVPAFASRVPYLTGLVELEEDPALRMATLLVGFDAERPSLGMRLRVEFQRTDSGIVIPVFRKRRDGD